ncbi:DUF134 domain-containing protein [Patescibacteria group bacterium]|nr:DUF134 domain-containing protein [Patescibacteria group bacterium]MBU1727990.1 DUF134 domain-containing protein [Patescibacteria group bacterium]
MPRLRRCLCKKIKFEPNVIYFKPQGVSMRNLEIVNLSMEEIEAYRLRHIDDLEQKNAAEKMGTSQSTYQRLLYSAYEKIADALVKGKAIKIIKHK